MDITKRYIRFEPQFYLRIVTAYQQGNWYEYDDSTKTWTGIEPPDTESWYDAQVEIINNGTSLSEEHATRPWCSVNDKEKEDKNDTGTV